MNNETPKGTTVAAGFGVLVIRARTGQHYMRENGYWTEIDNDHAARLIHLCGTGS